MPDSGPGIEQRVPGSGSIFSATGDVTVNIGYTFDQVRQLLELRQELKTFGTPVGESQRFEKGREIYEQALSFAREVDSEKALKSFEQALSYAREVGNEAAEATILNNIAELYQASGKKEQAEEYIRQARSIKQKMGEGAEAIKLKRLGLALSGGGVRAIVFHLGVLARLAAGDLLDKITVLSTVSGGSLCAGLVYAQSGFRWPTSQHYLSVVAPKARELLTMLDLERSLIWRALTRLFSRPLSRLEIRADDLSDLLKRNWGITINVRDLPEQPRWIINTTCYETGKNWRFEHSRMGDYVFGYSAAPPVPLSAALAASAGFPSLIGALALDARPYMWFKYDYKTAPGGDPDSREIVPVQPLFPEVHLWDGGVSDPLGLEPLHDFVEGWQQGIDFLMVSDASRRPGPVTYQPGTQALFRTNSIMMDQMRSLRSRALLARMLVDGDPGSYFQIGNTCVDVLATSHKKDEVARLCPECLSAEEVERAANIETAIRRVTPVEFESLFRHGFEVADYTLYAYHDNWFPYIGYANSHWG